MRKRRSAAANQGSFDSSSGARQMTVDNELGIYEAREVEEALAGHVGAIRECYGRAGKAQRYVGGNVTLRFLVSGQGTPTDVLVVTSDLGNYEVERCLVAVGRQVKFPPPEGHKATTFDYPVEFRSSGQMEVQDLDDSLKLDRDVAAFLPSLAECGRVAEGGASALLWVEPNGAVGSVGLAAEEPLDESAGSCVVKGIRRWKMSATLPGRVLRCRVSIPAVIAAAEPPPSRPSALSASVRRKRR
jgi:TonB family protein